MLNVPDGAATAKTNVTAVQSALSVALIAERIDSLMASSLLAYADARSIAPSSALGWPTVPQLVAARIGAL